jgi:Ca-activated chloride channel homolog
MKNLINIRLSDTIKQFFSLLFLSFSIISGASAQTPEPSNDKTLSPYFFIQGNDSQTDQLPLKSTKAEVNIAGIIADIKVTQEYKNEGKSPIEAIYVFPASTRAAVYKMTMTIGARVINAIIKERNQARQDYEEAKQQGKSASLLEQQRPNVFQMNVANIMPGDLIKVEMCYTELLVPENGVYEFVYPTVVGPRYSNQSAETAPENNKWVANPYTTEGKKAMYSFDIKVNLNAGMPVKDVRCDSHDMDIQYKSADQVVASLKPGNEFEGNRDVILKYRLKGDAIQSGLLLYKGGSENFFLAMMQPPQRVTADKIPPREYVFIVDVSGSMNGFPLDISKKVLRDLIGKLKSTDKFNVILFAGASNLMAEQSLNANNENINKAIQFIDAQQGGGGTELLPALQRALSLKGTENYARTFVILTDGYVDIEKDAFDLVRKNLGKANFFAFGIGSSVNRFLIEGLAHAGAGEPFVVENPDNAESMAQRFRTYIESPVLTNISINYSGFDVYDVEPLSVPDLFAERPVIVYGKWRGNPSGKIVLNGNIGSKKYSGEIKITTTEMSEKNAALRYLWARKRIQMLDDYTKTDGNDKKLSEEITGLGLKYNLLTAYTSFVAIDSEVRNQTGQSTTVKQPLPLPQGVSNYAVGGSASVNKGYAPASVKYRANSNNVKEEEFTSYDELATDKVEPKKKDSAVLVESATFRGADINAFAKYVLSQFKKPAGAKATGRLLVQFNVNENGKVTDIKILRSLGADIDNEIIRILKNSPNWTPAKKDGKAVKQQFVMPLNIK